MHCLGIYRVGFGVILAGAAVCSPAYGAMQAPLLCDSAVRAELTAKSRHLDAKGVQVTAHTLCSEALQAKLDPLLVLALIDVESTYDATVVSSQGAQGLMQILPATAHDTAARQSLTMGSRGPLDPSTNVALGVRYLAELKQEFGSIDLALLAYNIGPPNMRALLRHRGKAVDVSSNTFVARVARHQRALQKRYPMLASEFNPSL